MTDRDIEMTKAEQEFVKCIERALKFKIYSYGYNGLPQLGQPINFTARFPEYNRNLKRTPYLLKNTKKVLHFTSVEVLESIIKEGSLRLYNLQKSNDLTEYQYASDALQDVYELQGVDAERYQKWIEFVKENSFIFSATKIENLLNPEHWKKYGKNYEGVAIEFEIINEPVDWRLFYFAKVMYEQLGGVEALKEEWSKIQKDNPNNKYFIELNQMLSFHKSKSWVDEDEIRIYTQIPQVEAKLWNQNIFPDAKFSKYDKLIKYFKLPLCDKDGNYITPLGDERPYQYFPKLRISNIYFGADFDSGELEFIDFRAN